MSALRARCVVTLVTLLASVAMGASCKSPSPPGQPGAGKSTVPSVSPSGSDRTLVLYDTTGQFGFLGELYAVQASNLASHFGGWRAEPVSRYTSGEAARHDLTIYLGSTYDEPLPDAFLADVAAGANVLWLGGNIWKLAAKYPKVFQQDGFTTAAIDDAEVTEVRYHGTALTRDAKSGGLVKFSVSAPARAAILAEAVRADGGVVPWGVRGGRLTYVAE